MLINGGAINTSAINSYSLVIEYLSGIASYVFSGSADSTLTAAIASNSHFYLRADSKVTAAVYVGNIAPSVYSVTATASYRLESYVNGSTAFNYLTIGDVTPIMELYGTSSYSVSSSSNIRVIMVTGPSSVGYVVNTQGEQTLLILLEGVSSYAITTHSTIKVRAYISGESSYNINTLGSTYLKAVLQSLTEYTINSRGKTFPLTTLQSNSEYNTNSIGKINAVKYSQEVLEEFACVTYNVEMMDNIFRVSLKDKTYSTPLINQEYSVALRDNTYSIPTIENSVAVDATTVFEVNKC